MSAAKKKTRFSPEDLYLHQKISQCNASPTEPLVAACLKSLDRHTDSYESQIWAFPLEGAAPWQVTTAGTTNTSPHWSPDGCRLGFVSDREGQAQIFVIPRHGGEATPLSHVGGAVVEFDWHPDGQALLAICSLEVDPELRGERGDAPPTARDADAPRLAWKLPYKMDGTGYTLDREAHLFVIDAGTGEHRQVTDGSFDVRGAVWSPDGQQIAYVRTGEDAASHRTHVWVVQRDGRGARQLTKDQARAQYPVWSPDGRWIVFSGAEDEGDAQTRLWMIDLSSGSVEALGDESVEISTEGQSVQFAGEDAAQVWAVVAHRGAQDVVRVALPSGEVERVVTGDRQAGGLVVAHDRLVFTSESPVDAMELRVCATDGSEERCLSDINGWWKERTPATLERRNFEVPDGRGGTERVEGWWIRPADAGDRPTPLLVDMHGGPASFALFDYPPVAHWSVLWSRGWSVLALNAVGSASFGRPFCDCLCGHWGEFDLPQHLAAARQLQQAGLVDHRWAVGGQSYGGYLSAWAIGHTDAFKAAVVIAPVTNIETHYGISDSGYYADPYTLTDGGGVDRDAMRRLSVTHRAEGTRTPTLILQGEQDERCPKAQAEELFVAIRRNNDPPCELVLYPGAPHTFTGSGKPKHRVDVVQRIVRWLERHTGSSA